MTPSFQEILYNYWGYSHFRPLQEDIIQAVMQGKDTLALLPTGGGKSICYQVPALAQDGICLVISPLISLIKDQVEALQARGVRALAVFSGMSRREIDIALDNAVYGNYKFLYLSPERLETDIFKERAARMKVNLIAVDEAHCISEWGYDFRPSYLRIGEMREYFPKVPVLALTATATARVQDDIQDKLLFKPGHQTFCKSFDRPNLIYAVLDEEDKNRQLLKLLSRVQGTAIVYGSTRHKVKEVAGFLQKNRVSADYYHGGLNFAERSQKQDSWMNGQLRVIVATNAFGMGIDKPDVRLVVHYDLTESLEAYYQEAGRGGRDGKRSFAVLLSNAHDRLELSRKADISLPELEEIRQVYHALGNYYQLPEGNGQGESFEFAIADFAQKFDLKSIKVHNALKVLERAGYLSVSETVYLPSRLKIIVDNGTLYSFEIANKAFDPLLKTILRSYGGCFEEYVNINEQVIAQRTGLTIRKVITMLNDLKRMEMIDYIPQSNTPQITYLTERLIRLNLELDHKYLAERKSIYLGKIHAVIDYSEAAQRCKGKILLRYFGEEAEADCGHCDYCLKVKKPATEKNAMDIQSTVLRLLMQTALPMDELVEKTEADEKLAIAQIRRMIDEKVIRWKDSRLLEINS